MTVPRILRSSLGKVRLASVLTGALALASAVACRSAAERELGREVTRLGHLVNQLREAPNAQKAPSLRELQTAACQDARACQLKQLCAQAYELELRALDVTARLQASLQPGAPQPTDKTALARLVADAERDLAHSHQMMQQCVSLQGELEREHVAKR